MTTYLVDWHLDGDRKWRELDISGRRNGTVVGRVASKLGDGTNKLELE